MRHRISIRGSVRPTVRRSVNPYVRTSVTIKKKRRFELRSPSGRILIPAGLVSSSLCFIPTFLHLHHHLITISPPSLVSPHHPHYLINPITRITPSNPSLACPIIVSFSSDFSFEISFFPFPSSFLLSLSFFHLHLPYHTPNFLCFLPLFSLFPPFLSSLSSLSCLSYPSVLSHYGSERPDVLAVGQNHVVLRHLIIHFPTRSGVSV